MHVVSGHWRLGLMLSVSTMMLWAVLPLALKKVLPNMDVYTITWYRFFTAACAIALYQGYHKILPRLAPLKEARPRRHMILAILGLGANYLLYLQGLDYITPEAAQLVIQLGPMFLLLGSIWFYRESFSKSQWLGFGILVAGMLLFFNHRLIELSQNTAIYGLGIILIILAALLWAIYALAQKQLLRVYGSQQIMLLIYIVCSVALLPFVHIGQVMNLDAIGILLLAFCCANTLIAYGCFAEALDHWEASSVGAVLALSPLFTLIAMHVCDVVFPDALVLEPVNSLSIVGACLVVTGSMAAALRRGLKVVDIT